MTSGQFRAGAIGIDDQPGHSSAAGNYWLRIGRREIRLDPGETILGRDDTCHIVVTGALVSRRHAAAVLEGTELSIEDLGSANGTFVNRTRIHGRTPLQPGDSVFIGSCEIEIVRYGSGRPGEEPGSGDFVERKTPPSGVSIVGRVNIARAPADVSDAVTQRGDREQPVDTDALDSAARLAERMFALGRSEAGRKILSEPLEAILIKTRSGKVPEPELVDAVGRHAVRLAHELLDAKWVNLAIEIHWAAARPMRSLTLRQLIALRAKAPIGDDALIATYYERLRSRLAQMDATDRRLCEDLIALVPRLDERD